MAFTQRDNTGTLFKNDRRTEDKHPNAKGKALIGGVWYWMSAWTKQGNEGPFQSLAFEEMTADQAAKYTGGGNGQQRQQQQNSQPARQPQRNVTGGQRQRGGSAFSEPAPSLKNLPDDDIPF
jgi:hypothetical protein